MQRLFLTLMIAATLAGASVAQESDLDRLQGTWTMFSGTLNGRETILPEKERKSLQFIGARAILDDRMTVDVQLNSDADPKTMEWLKEVNGEKRTMTSFSYVLDGDTLLVTFEQGNNKATTKYVRADDPLREWTDATGKHKIRAKLVDVEKGAVILRREDGKLARLPLARLSQPDQAIVRQWQIDTFPAEGLKNPPRAWTDASGKHTIIAALHEIKEADVILKRADGSLTRSPLEKLSEADRAHVRGLQTSGKSQDAAIEYFKKLGAEYKPANGALAATLHLSGKDLPADAWPRLAQMIDVEYLSLTRSNVRDEHLVHVAKIKSLRSLLMSNTQIAGSGLVHLKGHPKLRVISLTSTKISDENLAALADIPTLERLNLSDTQITSAGLAHLKDAHKLQSISLDRTGVTDLAPLALLPSLSRISLANTPVEDAALATLRQCRALQDLTLYGSKVTDAGMAHVAQCKGLTRLSLSQTTISDAGLEPLTGLTQLKLLELTSTDVTYQGVDKLQRALPGTDIRHSGPTNAAEAAAVNYFKGLKQPAMYNNGMLSLYGHQFTPESLQQLAKFENLKHVSLVESNISDDGLASLKNCKELQSLTLRDTNITDAGLVHIGAFKKLIRLDLEQTSVTAAGIAKLKQQLPQCRIEHSPRDRPRNESKREAGEPKADEARSKQGADAPVDPAVEGRKAFKESLLGSQWRIGQLSITLNADGSTSGKWDRFNESRWEITGERSFAIIHTAKNIKYIDITCDEHFRRGNATWRDGKKRTASRMLAPKPAPREK